MATTQSVYGINQVKGPSNKSELRAFEVPVRVSGTYLTGTKPTFDFLAEIQKTHQGVTAVAVKRVGLLRDYVSANGATVLTAPNANISLGGTGNKDVTFRLDSGANNGDAGSEIVDATALDGDIVFLVLAVLTGL